MYNEQEANQALEDEVGISRAFQLGRIFEEAQQTASGNRFTLRPMPTAAEIFHKRAINRGYSERAIMLFNKLQ